MAKQDMCHDLFSKYIIGWPSHGSYWTSDYLEQKLTVLYNRQIFSAACIFFSNHTLGSLLPDVNNVNCWQIAQVLFLDVPFNTALVNISFNS